MAKIFENTTALAAATLTAGQMVSVKEVGEYRIKASGSGITLANGNVAVPVASGTAVNVKQFGAVGDGVADDTAAFNAALASLADNSSLKASGTFYLSDNITLANANNITLDFSDATLIQNTTFKKGLVIDTCTFVRCRIGEYRGLGDASGEWDNLSVSTATNGVHGIYIAASSSITIENSYINDVAGSGIYWKDSNKIYCRNNVVKGIGSHILIDNNLQGFGIGGVNDDTTTQDLEFEIVNNTISDTAFGIFANRIGKMTITGNRVFDIHGQHGIYLIESFNTVISNNIFTNCARQAIKTQNEDYVGRGVGPVGGNVDVTGITITGNVITGTGTTGIAMLTAPLYFPHDQFFDGVVVSGNNISGTFSNDGIILERVKGQVSGNTISGCARYGINVEASEIVLDGNTVKASGSSAIYGTLHDDSLLLNNNFIDCGLNNTIGGSGGDIPIYIYPIVSGDFSTTPPATMDIIFRNNLLRFTQAEGANTSSIAVLDTRISSQMYDNRTNSTKPFRTGARLTAKGGNTCTHFFDGADNAPATPYVGEGNIEFSGNTDPASAGLTSYFPRGAKCWNTNPSAAGQYSGWICTTAGSPGTWRPFGVIA